MIPRRFFWLFDLIVLALAFLGAYSLLPSYQSLFAPGGSLRLPWLGVLSPAIGSGPLPPLASWLWVYAAVAPPTLLFLELFGNYQPLLDQSRTRIGLGSFFAPLLGLSMVTLVLFAVKSRDASRLFVFSFALLSGISLGACRLGLRHYFRRRRAHGYYAKNAVLIGSAPALEWMTHYFAEDVPRSDYRLLGYLQICLDDASPSSFAANFPSSRTLASLPCLGKVEDLGKLLIRQPIHEVIAIQPATGGDWLQSVIQDCDYFRVTLRIMPEALLLAEVRDLKVMYRNEPLHLPVVSLTPPHLDSDALFLKRLMDILISAASLILLSPLLLLIALAIKITMPNQSIFYRWRVVGQKGVEFIGYKFTTMAADADERRDELMPKNEMNGPVFKIKDDPRVTALGRFLRKYSLNELPQLWSVLKGDMSLVGPRPAFRHELERYQLWHKRKLSIRPGITCLWQVRGRNRIRDFDEWVRMDLEYIDNWSLWLDFKILLWTAGAVLAGTGW